MLFSLVDIVVEFVVGRECQKDLETEKIYRIHFEIGHISTIVLRHQSYAKMFWLTAYPKSGSQ